MRFLLALVGALAFVVAVPSTSHACSCMERSTTHHVRSADLIVRGDVGRLDQAYERYPEDDIVFTVAVAEVYAGQAPDRIKVHTSGTGTMCGLDLEYGKEYLLFLDDQRGSWSGSQCGGTGPATASYVHEVERVVPGAGTPEAGGARLASSAVLAVTEMLLLLSGHG